MGEPKILVCAVLQSPAVKHVRDAQVVFNEAHVVPLFLGSGRTLFSSYKPASSLFRPLPIDVRALLKLLTREMIMNAVSRCAQLLLYIDPQFRGDFEFVTQAVHHTAESVRYAAAELRDSHEFWKAVASSVRDEKPVIVTTYRWRMQDLRLQVPESLTALAFAPVEVRDMREVMLPLVARYGGAVIYLGPKLCADHE